jgi:hypothetical protein
MTVPSLLQSENIFLSLCLLRDRAGAQLCNEHVTEDKHNKCETSESTRTRTTYYLKSKPPRLYRAATYGTGADESLFGGNKLIQPSKSELHARLRFSLVYTTANTCLISVSSHKRLPRSLIGRSSKVLAFWVRL